MENKNNILVTALRLFAAKGYDAVGVQEIVEASGITKPTLYHYFGSKRGLLDALLEDYFNNLIAVMKDASVYNHDLPVTLFKITRTVFDFARVNGSFYRMQLSMCFASPESESYDAVSKYNMEIFRILEHLFTLAASDHGNMKNRQKRYAFTFLGMINNYITLYLGNHIDLNDEMAHLAVQQYSYGIYS